MTDRPILFSAPMVNAILEGRKTQTRRVLKPQPKEMVLAGEAIMQLRKKTPYAKGDRLWVKEAHWALGHWEKAQGLTKMGREKWKFIRDFSKGVVFYKPIHIPPSRTHFGWHKRSSLFMFRADSRLTLAVTDVRVQRLQEISETDAKAEGVTAIGAAECPDEDMRSYVWAFNNLWDSLNESRGFGWDATPWVVAVTYETHHCNIDQMEAA